MEPYNIMPTLLFDSKYKDQQGNHAQGKLKIKASVTLYAINLWQYIIMLCNHR